MPVATIDLEALRVVLAKKRAELFEALMRNPSELHLAAEIKRLDDQMAECAEKMTRSLYRGAVRSLYPR